LSSFADGSDCPTIGPDGECCRCIGQALEARPSSVLFIVNISCGRPTRKLPS